MLLRLTVSLVLTADVTAALLLAEGGPPSAAPLLLAGTGLVLLSVALPAFLVLRRFGRDGWWGCIGAGFVVAALLAALLTLPVGWGFEQVGTEVTVEAGRRTAAGWRLYAENVGTAGAAGAGIGAVFRALLRLLEWGAARPRLRRPSFAAGAGLAGAATVALFALPSLTMDRSCHNVLRDGRTSIAPVLYFTVVLAGGEWPRFQEVADRFAAAGPWSVDESNDKDKGFSNGRFVSACVEPGTDIRFEGRDAPTPTRAEVSVFQPQGGTSWREPATRLLAAMEAAFPGRLRRGLSDAEAQTPAGLLQGE